MAEEYEEKSEPASGRKLEEAHRKGNIPKSRDITSLIPIWMFFLLLVYGGTMFSGINSYMKTSFTRISNPQSITELSLVEIIRGDIVNISSIMLPFFLTIFITILVVNYVQTGFKVSLGGLTPNFSKLNPLSGFKRLFSLNALFESLKGVLKITVFAFVLYLILKNDFDSYPLLVDMNMSQIIDFGLERVKKLLLIAAIVLTIFAAVDFAYQKWHFAKEMKMTKHEVKEEMKQTEGDPKVKARIRSLQREMARKRMMQEVPKADVVITNPTHIAVALKYDSKEMSAPKVIAKGANLVAEKIKEIAIQNKVPIYEDRPLARSLFQLELGQEIPETLYKAVAGILANIYKLKKMRSQAHA
ncbi:MAG: flagellar biosynthesis protein FlhB [Thermodesulfovibrionales bacterium]|nr:flagellar biosynthesis protein FlhB [Thermodesulfovibrionales bacterium]